MRRILRRLSVLLLLGVLGASALAEEFNSKVLGVEIALPEGWFEVGGDGVEELGLAGAAVFVSNDDREQCALIVSREPMAGRAAEAFVLASVFAIYNDMGGHILREEELTVGGEKGYRFIYEAGPKPGDQDFRRFYRVLVQRGDAMYIFQSSNSRKEFLKREGELSAMMKNVSWLNED